ncbi:MAG: hypothetical protein AAB618_02495 [Patescibacteria group bacterium]
MKKFIFTSVTFFILGILATLGVFLAVNSLTLPSSIKDGIGLDLLNPLTPATNETDTKDSTQSFTIGAEGLPLKNLSLGSAEKKALQAVGIDTETFIVTEAMLECANGKVGNERVTAFVDGAVPSVIEIGKLLPCLKQ